MAKKRKENREIREKGERETHTPGARTLRSGAPAERSRACRNGRNGLFALLSQFPSGLLSKASMHTGLEMIGVSPRSQFLSSE